MKNVKKVFAWLDERVFDKKKVLLLALIPSLYYGLCYLLFVLGAKNTVAYNLLMAPLFFIGNHVGDTEVLIWIFPIAFIFSSITYFLSDRIFCAWRTWTGMWLILFFTNIAMSINVTGGGGIDVGPNLDAFVYFLLYGLYALVSIIVIFISWLRERRGK